jgi:hypothetical protein
LAKYRPLLRSYLKYNGGRAFVAGPTKLMVWQQSFLLIKVTI